MVPAGMDRCSGRIHGRVHLLLVIALMTVLACCMPGVAHAVNFTGPTNIAVGNNPQSVAVGDFNGDSDPDLAVVEPDLERRLGAARRRPGGLSGADELPRRHHAAVGRGGRVQRRLGSGPRGRQRGLERRLGAARRTGGKLHRPDQLPGRHHAAIGRGRRVQRRLGSRPGGRERGHEQRLDPARRRRRRPSPGRRTSPSAARPARSRWATSTATPIRTSRSRTRAPTTSRCCSARPAAPSGPDQLRRLQRAHCDRRGRVQRRLRSRPGGRQRALPQRLGAARRCGGDVHGAARTSRPGTCPTRSRWRSSTATRTPTWRWRTRAPTASRCCSAAPGGAFIGPIDFPIGDGPTSVAVADFNGDARPDIAVTNELVDSVSILLASSTGGYPRPKGATPLDAVAGPGLQPSARAGQRERHPWPCAGATARAPAGPDFRAS